jgi:superfamily II DNA or RNA helicase
VTKTVKASFSLIANLDDYDSDYINLIKSHLSVDVRDYMTDEITTVEYFHINEKEKTISLPKYYPLKYDESINSTTKGGELSSNVINAKFSYRDGQEEDVNLAMSEDILTFVKPPGSGKTIIGMSVIQKRSKRTLILVDQDTLRKQWINAGSIVFGKKIKIKENIKLDGNKDDIGYDIYIGTIQGVVAKIRKYGVDEVKKFYESYNIGQVIFDECHVLIGPEKFSLFGHICNSHYILALSATPRDDVYIKYWLGSIVLGDTNYEVEPNIVELKFNAKLSEQSNYINWGGKFRKDRHASALFKNTDYMEFLSSIIYKSHLNKRQVLVIFDYNKFGLNNLYDFILGYNKDVMVEVPGRKNRKKETVWIPGAYEKILTDEVVGKYISGCDVKVEEKKPIILSNYKMLQKGVDIPTLDTLIMATELGNLTSLEQVVGRLLRLNKGITKKELLVCDIQETSMSKTLWRKDKRFGFYAEKEFDII